MASRNALVVGSPAPDFTLHDQSGRAVHFAELLKQGPVVLYFYPKDHTPGCTLEACGFRDAQADFAKAGATVVGVSDDTVAEHARFAAQHALPFTLLSDARGQVRELYGVPRLFGVIPGRVTFVVDPDGMIRHAFTSHLRMQRHVVEALETVRKLAQGGSPASGGAVTA